MNNNLHLFVKFHQNGQGEFNGIKTMDEHLMILDKKDKMCWGHFTKNSTKKGLWDEKIKKLEFQIKSGQDSYVFFCDRESKMLFVGRYIESYKRKEVEKGHPILEYIPQYYHHKVGTPIEYNDDELRSYAYIVVSDVKQIPMEETENIYSNTNGKKILESDGMASILYVNLSNDLSNRLLDDLQKEVAISVNRNLIEELDEIQYQDIITKTSIDCNCKIEDNVEFIDDKKTGNRTLKWNRNPTKAKKAIILSNYKCEFNNSHTYFISNVTKENYVEAHHLIPMEYQDKFKPKSLDVEANIISLCIVCHKKLHHGTFNDKKEIIKKLYKQRIERLKKCEIDIPLDNLLNLYK